MQELIDAVRATFELAAGQGSAHARIALQPEELGAVRIHLTQTADGLLARLTADTPAAAQALAQGRGELHQSLSSLGVSLLRLEISSFAQSREHAGRSGADAHSTRDGRSSEQDDQPSADESQPSSRAPRPGALVDVLA